MWDSKRGTDEKNKLLDSMREGEGGQIWENSTETNILPYVKQITNPGSIHETGCSGLVHWDDLEGEDGEGGGSGVQDGEHMYTHGWFMSMYGKSHNIKARIYNGLKTISLTSGAGKSGQPLVKEWN